MSSTGANCCATNYVCRRHYFMGACGASTPVLIVTYNACFCFAPSRPCYGSQEDRYFNTSRRVRKKKIPLGFFHVCPLLMHEKMGDSADRPVYKFVFACPGRAGALVSARQGNGSRARACTCLSVQHALVFGVLFVCVRYLRAWLEAGFGWVLSLCLITYIVFSKQTRRRLCLYFVLVLW